MGIRDDIVNGFNELVGNTYNPETASNTETFFDLLYPLALIGFILAIGFSLWRYYRYVTSYAGDGEPLGPFKITIQGLTTVKGNLSRHYYISDSEYMLLESLDHKEVVTDIEDFRNRVEQGKLFVYDFRITDYDEAFDLKGGQDSIVLSPVDLESNDFSWLDSKGERSITSPTFRVKHRNVVCFSMSRYHQDQVMADRDVDVYDLVPIPKTLTSMRLDSETEVVLHLEKLANAQSDATTSEYLKTIAENWQEISPLRKEIERLRKLIIDKDVELSDVHREGEHDRHLAYTNPVIGHKNKPKEIPTTSFLMTLVAVFFAGGMAALLPDMIPTLGVSGLLTLMGGAGILFAVAYMMLDKKDAPRSKETAFGT